MLSGRRLYFADVDALVVADADSGRVLERIQARDAAQNPSLNDLAIDGDGTVFVSGSRSRTIYRLEAGELVAWLKDDHRLESANGLYASDGRLVHGGKRWTVFDIRSRQPRAVTPAR